MKVLFVGYDLDPARAGRGGVAVYQSSLARALRSLGCEVTLFLGTCHTLQRRPRLSWSRRDGMTFVELIDSPLHHCDHHVDPSAHISSPVVDELTREVLRQERPDVVHIHDPRLHPASVIDVSLAEGCVTLKTVHNHFDVCPQGELFAEGREICRDYEEGRRCARCLAGLPPLSRLRGELSGTLAGLPLGGALRRGLALARRVTPRRAGGSPAPAAPRPLPHAPALYVARRRALLDRLGRLSAVHVYSRYTLEYLAAQGVPREKLRLIHVSSALLERITAKPERAATASAPLTFGYVTGASRSKGFYVLLDAFSRLPSSRARLLIYGVDDPASWARRYSGVEFRPTYDPYREIDQVLAPIDVGVVPTACVEVFGLAGVEFLSARIPVIGSDVGGIPDWLEDGVNGLLVPPGDPAALAAAMLRFLDEPGLVSRLQAGARPWKGMRTHAEEMRALYRELLA